MPNMDGYKATQTIRKFADQKKANITIIAMTANAFDEDRRNAFQIILDGRGTDFDPDIVDAFMMSRERIDEIMVSRS